MVRVKICGITNLEDARLTVKSGADAIGFVFAESPRQITPEDAAKIIKQMPPFISTVGVFVDSAEQSVNQILQICHLDAVQFHGSESREYCLNFKNQVKVIKTLRVKDSQFLEVMVKYDVDAFLLDTYLAGQPGGTGEVFDWELAARARKTNSHLILAGGLNIDNICQAIEVVRPYAVDVSSGVESSQGKKDPVLVKQFISRAKRCALLPKNI